MVGDTHTIQALNAAAPPVTGLTWVSSDPTTLTVSTDNPPLLTALAAGEVAIAAGVDRAFAVLNAGKSRATPLSEEALWFARISNFVIRPARQNLNCKTLLFCVPDHPRRSL